MATGESTFNGVLGYIDYAGSSVVHAAGGTAALWGLLILGPRHGRFGVDGIVCDLEGQVVRCSDSPLALYLRCGALI